MQEEKDKFDAHLENMIKTLQECQEKHSLKSCFECEMLLECETRKNYVNAVYLSMSKGAEGGFDF
ncbi:hypothetical protein [Campylobacter geochelonis]|uniref:Uncharacterized protein n=2 Tax=Campylobacter geochelonis TaxID=1780362 RepID=A0A128EL52_9BACT|nr:hypothetical protein [Campylobacter geochelonis]QKF71654.1 hypothetical protein CGEO_1362 [Campylobacter geochelonis]CZE49281.1 Uncharacterised protein [Campylobacter geochelonis]CZE49397.1 Uncharacterised protein [Campylobacter geochelonis]CZE51484.1 Uncharacterised protein [Campylobacter geochelonis]